ncbi:hypothetical protein E1301_Tti021650 [Triplophysa tibetana]|uniref:HECT domain-containing protein n=1 Tax=Triplophysa tibetana TaxID=1572043 RepID=A0A5A9PSM4_9TELE|nr:hypothetical protein E1301_Tti021650 [Triplophysa tibetana]
MTFIGEDGVDSGALRKEFLTEKISGVEKRLFLGQRAKSPQYSNSDLDNGLFRLMSNNLMSQLNMKGHGTNKAFQKAALYTTLLEAVKKWDSKYTDHIIGKATKEPDDTSAFTRINNRQNKRARGGGGEVQEGIGRLGPVGTRYDYNCTASQYAPVKRWQMTNQAHPACSCRKVTFMRTSLYDGYIVRRNGVKTITRRVNRLYSI